jgi:hypothetical protein
MHEQIRVMASMYKRSSAWINPEFRLRRGMEHGDIPQQAHKRLQGHSNGLPVVWRRVMQLAMPKEIQEL